MVTALSRPLCGLCRGKENENCWGNRAGTESARPSPAPGAPRIPFLRETGLGTRRARGRCYIRVRYVNGMSAGNVGTAPVPRIESPQRCVLTGRVSGTGNCGAAGQQNGAGAAGLTAGLCRLSPSGARCERREPCPVPSGGDCAGRTGAGLSEPGKDRRSPPETGFLAKRKGKKKTHNFWEGKTAAFSNKPAPHFLGSSA